MGCGASAPTPPKPLNEEQKQTVMNIACKEMCVLTASETITSVNIEDKNCPIVVNLPDIMQNFAGRIRKAGKWAQARLQEEADKAGDVAADAAAKVGGGMMGSLMDKAAGAVSAVSNVAAGAGGAALKESSEALAKGMDAAVEQIRKPLTEVGRDIVHAKKKDITNIFIQNINQHEFKGAEKLIRGELTKGADGKSDTWAEAPKGTEISDAYTLAMVQPLAMELLPMVEPEIEKHAVTTAWKAGIDYTNEAIKKMEEMAGKLPGNKNIELMENPLQKIELDIKNHIVTEVIKKICEIMGNAEKGHRDEPGGKSQKPRLFGRCFQKPFVILTEHDLKDEHDPNVTYDK